MSTNAGNRGPLKRMNTITGSIMSDLLLLYRTNTNHIEINVSFTLLTVVREKLAKLKYDPKCINDNG